MHEVNKEILISPNWKISLLNVNYCKNNQTAIVQKKPFFAPPLILKKEKLYLRKFQSVGHIFLKGFCFSFKSFVEILKVCPLLSMIPVWPSLMK